MQQQKTHKHDSSEFKDEWPVAGERCVIHSGRCEPKRKRFHDYVSYHRATVNVHQLGAPPDTRSKQQARVWSTISDLRTGACFQTAGLPDGS